MGTHNLSKVLGHPLRIGQSSILPKDIKKALDVFGWGTTGGFEKLENSLAAGLGRQSRVGQESLYNTKGSERAGS